MTPSGLYAAGACSTKAELELSPAICGEASPCRSDEDELWMSPHGACPATSRGREEWVADAHVRKSKFLQRLFNPFYLWEYRAR